MKYNLYLIKSSFWDILAWYLKNSYLLTMELWKLYNNNNYIICFGTFVGPNTPPPNLVLIGQKLTILQNTSYMIHMTQKRYYMVRQNRDLASNAFFDKEQHASN